MELYKSSRGGKVCFYKGHEFILYHKKSAVGTTKWRCRSSVKFMCRSTKIADDKNEVVAEVIEHCHDTDLPKAFVNKVASSSALAALPKKSTIERQIHR